MRRLLKHAWLGLLLAAGSAESAPPVDRALAVKSFREQHATAILTELADFLALPNLATDAPAIRKNAEHLKAMLERRGLAAELLESPGSPPAVFASRTVAGARRTVVFYAHYDGQPTDATQWVSPPFTPTFLSGPREAGGQPLPWPGTPAPLPPEARLYARSASDDKAPIVALLAALDALEAAGVPPSVNLKFFFEGEEEAGSPHLGEMLRAHAARLAADAWLFLDGPAHPSRRLQVVFGARGVMGLELTLYGPTRALHSGHYGNWAPNPAVALAELVAGLRSSDGEIKVAGFYDSLRPLTPADRAALAALPDPDAELRAELGLAASEAGNARLAERILLPALNVRGLEAGRVGAAAANAIPTVARASIDFRLVPDQTPEEVRRLVEQHFVGLGWHLLHEEPDLATRLAHPKLLRLDWEGGYRAVRTPLDLPLSRAVLAVASHAAGEKVLAVPMLGGSLPLYHFEDVLHAPLVIVPIVNHDNNQHAANENLRLANLWQGIDLFAALLAELGGAWEGSP
ncbi:MAG: M20/M25/M40 family metallo-hydrolase [Thermoanaerobaculia bacterium]